MTSKREGSRPGGRVPGSGEARIIGASGAQVVVAVMNPALCRTVGELVTARGGRIRPLNSWVEPSLVVFDTEGAGASGVLDAVRQLRARWPRAALVWCHASSAAELHRLQRLAIAGLDDHVDLDAPDARSELRRVVAERVWQLLPTVIWDAIPQRDDAFIRALMSWIYRAASREVPVVEVAWHFRVSAKHLRGRLRQAKLAPTRDQLRLGRLCHIACVLQGFDGRLADVAMACGFETANALNEFVRDLTRMSTTNMWREGAVEVAVAAVAEKSGAI